MKAIVDSRRGEAEYCVSPLPPPSGPVEGDGQPALCQTLHSHGSADGVELLGSQASSPSAAQLLEAAGSLGWDGQDDHSWCNARQADETFAARTMGGPRYHWELCGPCAVRRCSGRLTYPKTIGKD